MGIKSTLNEDCPHIRGPLVSTNMGSGDSIPNFGPKSRITVDCLLTLYDSLEDHWEAGGARRHSHLGSIEWRSP